VGLLRDGKAAVKIFLARPDVRGLPRVLDGVPVAAQVTGQFIERQPGNAPKVALDASARAEHRIGLRRLRRTGHPRVKPLARLAAYRLSYER